jgi:hypothetical protein
LARLGNKQRRSQSRRALAGLLRNIDVTGKPLNQSNGLTNCFST